jgi:hypothetical protein
LQEAEIVAPKRLKPREVNRRVADRVLLADTAHERVLAGRSAQQPGSCSSTRPERSSDVSASCDTRTIRLAVPISSCIVKNRLALSW